jgi:DNA-binding MurR/RpiR family transcriptional regulator
MLESQTIATLNNLELMVYHYVIKHKQQVTYMTIRELSQAAQVSTTTVLRFCKKLGCDGYSEFRIRFKLYLQQEQVIPQTFGTSEIINYFKSIDNQEFGTLLNQAAEKIRSAERVFFVGASTSGSLGKYGARFFSNVGKFSTYIDDPYYPINSDMYANALAIILSVSGETAEILRLAQQFSLHRCQIISITNHDTCSLARLADLNISYHMPTLLLDGNYNITTQVPVIYILETLGKKLPLS